MRLVIGKARSGKTAFIYREIQDAVERGKGHCLLIVPEQYSHEAERELCRLCGDRLSLYAEVMSFTGLARWSMGEYGGEAVPRMDRAGKLLCMSSALKEIQPFLMHYATAVEHVELQMLLVKEIDRLRSAGADSTRLLDISNETDGLLSEKLREIALINDTYDTVVSRAGATSEDPLELLAKQILEYGLGNFDRVYVDGFIDFTGLELAVLKAITQRQIALTICLDGDRKENCEEYLLPSRMAMDRLKTFAEECGSKAEVKLIECEERGSALHIFTDNMFRYDCGEKYQHTDEIRLIQARNPREECEAAAELVLNSVRDEGLRWRDIAIAVRGFEDYRIMLESCFRRYAIPLFVSRRESFLNKPLPLWLESAYDIVLGNWDCHDVTTYLRCGLNGLSEERCDELCAYIYKWQMKSQDWMRKSPWTQHPDGYGKKETNETRDKLRRINQTRRLVSEPLLLLKKLVTEARTAIDQVNALKQFIQRTELAKHMKQRARLLQGSNRMELQAEYQQLWDICSGAVLQVSSILGGKELTAEAFRLLLHTMFAQYDIGLIPVALDRVSAGDFDRMRRRNIRKLIVLGCSDDRLPGSEESAGLFTEDERDVLAEHKLMIGGGETELWREYSTVYHTLSLPNDQLIMIRPLSDTKGEKVQPAFAFQQALKLFDIRPENADVKRARLSAPAPALGLAVSADSVGSGKEEQAAEAWFLKREPEHLRRLHNAAKMTRGTLSSSAVEALYGHNFRISPSRLEKFSSCRFAYYCRFGLNAEKDEPASYMAPEIGTFTHRILEKTAKEVKELGGFRNVTDEQLREITERYIKEYINEDLKNFEEKSLRFRHLFERLCEDVYQIVKDMADELRKSDFVPIDFELDISELGISIPVKDGVVRLGGIADRVDGWEEDGVLHLRIVDYKTGQKSFSLSDVCYGYNMQMLLYLFAVCDRSEELYEMRGEPAGILYLPAREELMHFDSEPNEQETEKQKAKEKRRSGLVLNDPSIIQAWENGETKRYIPENKKNTNPLVSIEQLGILHRHVVQTLGEMASELRAGKIDANPSWVSATDNACKNCDYHSICHFEEGVGGERSNHMPKMDDETVWELLAKRGE